MLLWHIALLPLVVGILVVAHIVLVRRHGVVPPFDAWPPEAGLTPNDPPEDRHASASTTSASKHGGARPVVEVEK